MHTFRCQTYSIALTLENSRVPGTINGLKFTYGNIDFNTYQALNSTTTNSQKWLTRKVAALPFTLWYGIIKTTYHTAILIITSIGILIVSKGHPNKKRKIYIKTQSFCVARNLQESFGWFLTFFNDSRGSYHVLEARTHRAVYNNLNILQNPQHALSGNQLPPAPHPLPHTPPVEPKKTDFANLTLEALDIEVAKMAQAPLSQDQYNDYVMIANRYLSLFDPKSVPLYYTLDKAHEILNKLMTITNARTNDTDEQKQIRDALVRAHANYGERSKAFSIIMECKVWSNIEPLLLELAQSYFNERNYDEIYKIIQEVSSGVYTKQRHEFIMEVSRQCIENDDKENAVKFLELIWGVYEQADRDLLLINIANLYFEEGNYEVAFETITKIQNYATSNVAGKENVLDKIVKYHIYYEKNYEKAKAAINKINDREKITLCLASLIEEYLKINDLENAMKIVIEIPFTHKSLVKELIKKFVDLYKDKGTDVNIKQNLDSLLFGIK
jgi:tetratricopeptide (TPR) repeat protein